MNISRILLSQKYIVVISLDGFTTVFDISVQFCSEPFNDTSNFDEVRRSFIFYSITNIMLESILTILIFIEEFVKF